MQAVNFFERFYIFFCCVSIKHYRQGEKCEKNLGCKHENRGIFSDIEPQDIWFVILFEFESALGYQWEGMNV